MIGIGRRQVKSSNRLQVISVLIVIIVLSNRDTCKYSNTDGIPTAVGKHGHYQTGAILQDQDDDVSDDFMVLGQYNDTTDTDNTDDEVADGRSKHARRKAKLKLQKTRRSGHTLDNTSQPINKHFIGGNRKGARGGHDDDVDNLELGNMTISIQNNSADSTGDTKDKEQAFTKVPTGLQLGLRNSYDKQVTKNDKRRGKKINNQSKKAMGDTSNITFVDLWHIDRRIRDFINDDQLNSFQFAPMDKISRRQLHILSTAYNLTSKSIGTGKLRTPILTKTETTCIPQDNSNIHLFIEEAQATITVQHNLTQKRIQAPVSKSRQGSADIPSVHGTVVASGAAPITESNVGHRMMTAMGWKVGNGLGTNQEGIIDPIEAVIRSKRRGLGA